MNGHKALGYAHQNPFGGLPALWGCIRPKAFWHARRARV